jgi:hypothetical protein
VAKTKARARIPWMLKLSAAKITDFGLFSKFYGGLVKLFLNEGISGKTDIIGISSVNPILLIDYENYRSG